MSTDETTAPPQGPPPGYGTGAGALPPIATLRRSRTDRKLAGVAGGLGRYAGVDPLILRILFVVLTIFGGSGILLYVARLAAHRRRRRGRVAGPAALPRPHRRLDRVHGRLRDRRAHPRAGLHGRGARHRTRPRRSRRPGRRRGRSCCSCCATGSDRPRAHPARCRTARCRHRSRRPAPAPSARPPAPPTPSRDGRLRAAEPDRPGAARPGRTAARCAGPGRPAGPARLLPATSAGAAPAAAASARALGPRRRDLLHRAGRRRPDAALERGERRLRGRLPGRGRPRAPRSGSRPSACWSAPSWAGPAG